MPTLNFPGRDCAESRLILSCSSCMRPRWPQRGRPPSPHVCPALRQEETSFLLSSTGQAGWEHCWLPREPAEALLLLWWLIPLYCLAQRREQLLACTQNQSAAPSAPVQKKLIWQVVTPLPSGNPAEKVGTERFCIKRCLNLYHLLRGSLSGL